jgi:hypothetical protein
MSRTPRRLAPQLPGPLKRYGLVSRAASGRSEQVPLLERGELAENKNVAPRPSATELRSPGEIWYPRAREPFRVRSRWAT